MRSGAIPFGKDRDKDRPLWEEQRLSEHGEEEGLQGRLLDHTGCRFQAWESRMNLPRHCPLPHEITSIQDIGFHVLKTEIDDNYSKEENNY